MEPRAAQDRIAALDAARALGVGAMVIGHALDALLDPAVRAHPALVAYWKARGFTAPVFIGVAGWAVAAAIRRSGDTGWSIPVARAPRAALLFAFGFALNWPGWGIDALRAGHPAVVAHLASFGVLQAIAASTLLTAAIFALLPGGRERYLGLGAAAAVAVALGMRLDGNPRTLVGIVLEQAIGGTSMFPVFPWGAYFFAGAAVGLAVERGDRREGGWLALAGAAGIAATAWTGVGTMPAEHPVLVVYRISAFLLLLGLLTLVPADWARRAAPLGRASLAIYVLHVPIVYGWSTHAGLATRVGPVLGLGRALLVAGLLLVGSASAAWAFGALRRALPRVAGWRPGGEAEPS